jgi:monoamine oxidase
MTTVPDPDVEVVVIGAGLAGLVAARDLHERGHTVTVLEARHRVGGRVLTEHFPGVGRIDLGAEWMSPTHHVALSREISRYGLRLVEAPPVTGYHWWFGSLSIGNEAPLTESERTIYQQLLDDLDNDSRRVDFSDPTWQRVVNDLDVALSDYVNSRGVPDNVAHLLYAEAFGLMGADPHEYSALNLLHEIAGFGSADNAFNGRLCRLDGGMGSLPMAMAAGLPGTTRYDHQVSAVTTHEHGIEVIHSHGVTTASAAVVTVPFNALARVRFTPDLDDEVHTAVKQRHAGRVAKVWAQVPDSISGLRSVGWPGMAESYTFPGTEGLAAGGFLLTDSSTQQLEATFLRDIRRHFPDLEPGKLLWHNWVTDPHAQGSWHCARPGQSHALHRLAGASPPLIFAGGDVTGEWVGWMDGAVTSGKAAAVRLHDYLRSR